MSNEEVELRSSGDCSWRWALALPVPVHMGNLFMCMYKAECKPKSMLQILVSTHAEGTAAAAAVAALLLRLDRHFCAFLLVGLYGSGGPTLIR